MSEIIDNQVIESLEDFSHNILFDSQLFKKIKKAYYNITKILNNTMANNIYNIHIMFILSKPFILCKDKIILIQKINVIMGPPCSHYYF